MLRVQQPVSTYWLFCNQGPESHVGANATANVTALTGFCLSFDLSCLFFYTTRDHSRIWEQQQQQQQQLR
jgi:hypothetical protein